MSKEALVPFQSLTHFYPNFDLKDFILGVIFRKSSAASYPIVVWLAKGATEYREGMISGKLFHAVLFGKNPDDANRAVKILEHAAHWKGFEIFAGGRIVRYGYHLTQVLECYLEAAQCKDYRAHCFCKIENPFENEMPSAGAVSFSFSLADLLEKKPPEPIIEMVEEYTFPCSLLKSIGIYLSADHPSAPADQIQSAGVHQNIHLCPLFDSTQFKRLGRRLVNLKQR